MRRSTGRNCGRHITELCTMATKGVITWATCGPLITAILLVTSGSIVVAAPTCGQHEYLENSQCLPCPTCPPGYGVSGPCGFGRGALTTCIPCEPGPQDPQTWPTFSDSTSQESCQPCKLCDNSHYSVNCSADTNSHCGPCLFGFYRTHPDEENCLPCKHVIPPYAHLCKDWLDAQTTTMPTMTGPPTDVSTEPVTTTKKMVVTSDRDVLAVSSEDNNSNGYDTTPIIIMAVLVGLGVFTFMAYKCGFLPYRKSTNPGPIVSTVDSAQGSEDAGEHMDQHDTDDPGAGQ
ncbi:tumor necrosis factor receptor superfamily member 14-like isoform X1 [Branchiostoma lanceolatum]|uniref:tumor necrosis factor receptor superfamily member 14-like isoform X1 n=1 Tax=Branchiostoma lanceolatum TaxID=7740 RepID=UPI003451747C